MNKVLNLFYFTDDGNESQTGEVICRRFQLIVPSWASESGFLPPGPNLLI